MSSWRACRKTLGRRLGQVTARHVEPGLRSELGGGPGLPGRQGLGHRDAGGLELKPALRPLWLGLERCQLDARGLFGSKLT